MQPIITTGDASLHILPPPSHQHISAMSSDLEEELGSHDSLLEYINSMLMDETFEDSCCLANANGSRVVTNRWMAFQVRIFPPHCLLMTGIP